jgi:starch phosphorylase
MDRAWEACNPEVWHQTRNPVLAIQNTPRSRLEELARDATFVERLRQLERSETEHLSRPSWFQQTFQLDPPPVIAYFSMEYGLTDAMPLYSGGLGVLAGDHLKTASDLGSRSRRWALSPGFRQMLDGSGSQLEPMRSTPGNHCPCARFRIEGMPLCVTLELPGRELRVRVWRASVGRVDLCSTATIRSPAVDRGITARSTVATATAPAEIDRHWRLAALVALGIKPDVCHLNEGHAALATIERACARACQRHGLLHGAVGDAGRQRIHDAHAGRRRVRHFRAALLENYGPDYARSCGLTPDQLMGLGRVHPHDRDEPFNMAYRGAPRE